MGPQADALLYSFFQAITLRIAEAAVLVVGGEEMAEADAAATRGISSHTPNPTPASKGVSS
jgi:hypothetical protein